MKNSNILITGVSSGIGNTLCKLLIKKGFKVWGIARRKNLLDQLNKQLKSNDFTYTAADVSGENFWQKLIQKMKVKKFTPQTIIFNAAIHQNDLEKGINLEILKNIMDINFFSVLKGVKEISENYHASLHFIAISSASAFKGNHSEGIGYSASKGALSNAFESLYQKHISSKITFTTIFLGPVVTDMIRFAKQPPLTLTQQQVAGYILNAIYEKKPFYYYPKAAFKLLSVMRLLPKETFFKLWSRIQKRYT